MSTSLVNIESCTNTTKALLLQVTAPRKIAAKKEPLLEVAMEEKTEATQSETSTTFDLTITWPTPKGETDDATKSATKGQPEPVENGHKDTSASGRSTGNPVVDGNGSDKVETSESRVLAKPGDEEKAAPEDTTVTTAMADYDEESVLEVTPEQAAAVVDSLHDPTESEINVEELIRITFQALLEEYHLLTIPTYSYVAKTQKDLTTASALDSTFARIHFEDNTANNWIRVDAMIFPEKLGIVFERLEHIGVGSNVGTLVVLQTDFCRTASPFLGMPQHEVPANADVTTLSLDNAEDQNYDSDSSNSARESRAQHAIDEARKEWRNAATRLRIEQVREQICEQAQLSFDFIALLAIASILAGIGLITNNSVVIVASMLVSPIMGPVMGICFGSRVRDWPLVRVSLFNESLALLGCVFIGCLVTLCAGFTNLATDTWPTAEMASRGDPIGLITGIAVAIPSGMGVCLSILGGNTSSLVGVAISASLLPPAVNAGICFVFAIMVQFNSVETVSSVSAVDYARIGAISFGLTVVNIVCIWVAGIIMFEIKEVAPTKQKNAFWAKDIKLARELNTKAGPGHKPAPLNLDVLQRGARTAHSRMQSARARPTDTGMKNRLDKRRHTVVDRPSLDTSFAFRPSRRSVVRSSGAGSLSPPNFDRASFAFQPSSRQINPSASAELSLAAGRMSPLNTVEEDGAYFSLEDMAGLLGSGEDEDEEERFDPAVFARRLGLGRYL